MSKKQTTFVLENYKNCQVISDRAPLNVIAAGSLYS